MALLVGWFKYFYNCLISWDFHTQVYRVYTEWGEKQKKILQAEGLQPETEIRGAYAYPEWTAEN